ncbi:MAG: DUF393 domain-containing protein [Proteobacteria bacterium]|nr:DUF393 domain-containing protein [Pseudomonadota bacterium]
MKKEIGTFQVFYDGACHLCSREINHYRKKVTTVPFEYIDISAPDFDAKSYGLNNEKVQLEMHIKCEDGAVRTGVEAFLEMWRRMPSFQKLAWALDREWVKPILRLGYFTFARVRPYLPKRKRTHCETGTCGVKQK